MTKCCPEALGIYSELKKQTTKLLPLTLCCQNDAATAALQEEG